MVTYLRWFWNFTMLYICSVQTSGGPGTSRPIGWRGTCTGQITPGCTGSATTRHTGADFAIPLMWDSWGVPTAPGSSQTLTGNLSLLPLTLYGGKCPILRPDCYIRQHVYNVLHRSLGWCTGPWLGTTLTLKRPPWMGPCVAFCWRGTCVDRRVRFLHASHSFLNIL